MAQINEHYLKLKAGYLFPEIARRVKAYAADHPQAKIIRMGIGDVTEPLAPAVVAAMQKAVEEMSQRATFQGYGPEQGFDFLRDAIARNDFQARQCDISADEIFVSDGSKCDTGNILDIFGPDNVIELLSDYDVIVDGTDNFPTRYLLNDASVRLRKPVVSASILSFDGQLSTFVPYEGPCYRCLYPTPPPPGLVPS